MICGALAMANSRRGQPIVTEFPAETGSVPATPVAPDRGSVSPAAGDGGRIDSDPGGALQCPDRLEEFMSNSFYTNQSFHAEQQSTKGISLRDTCQTWTSSGPGRRRAIGEAG